MELYLGWLMEAVRQPSVSMYNAGMGEMASICARFLEDKLGLKAEMIETCGSPYIYAHLDEGAKDTLAFYNHYDVMPAEPLEEWESPPFEPVVRDGRLWGRGVADNKGSMFSRICAVHACKQVYGKLPVNLKFFYDGEEEIGSPHLDDFVRANGGLLKCDGFFWEGGSRDLERGASSYHPGSKGHLQDRVIVPDRRQRLAFGERGYRRQPLLASRVGARLDEKRKRGDSHRRIYR